MKQRIHTWFPKQYQRDESDTLIPLTQEQLAEDIHQALGLAN
jgi:hypothetical protein